MQGMLKFGGKTMELREAPRHFRCSLCGDVMGLLNCEGRKGELRKPLTATLKAQIHRDSPGLRIMQKNRGNPHRHSGSYNDGEAEVMCGWVWERDEIKLSKVHEHGTS